MSEWLQDHKPAAPVGVHLLLAALMWTAVGGALLFFGARWVWMAQLPHGWLLLAAGVLAGLVKTRFVLWSAAGRITNRIITHGDGRCVGGFLSLRTWAFVVVMVAAGRLLRGAVLPRTAVGLVYAAVGVALLTASLRLWSIWRSHRSTNPESATATESNPRP